MANDLTADKLFKKLEVYKNNANDCIFFRYIFDENDLKAAAPLGKKSIISSAHGVDVADENTFKPEFTHQIFGDDEIIFGYKNLRVDYFLTPGLLDAYIGVSCKEKMSAKRFEGIEPDDIYGAFSEFGCSPGFTRNLDVFSNEKLRNNAEFKPFGQKIYEYETSSSSLALPTKYEVYKVDSSMPEYENKKFVDYILRVQTMLVFFIEVILIPLI